MNLLLRPVRSSLGSKYVMAVTGLALIGFVLVHMAGNLQIFLGREALNAYAHHLEELPTLLWMARAGLLLIFVVHILFGLRLWMENRRARPVRYAYEDTVYASWASRHMLLTGLVILAFVIYHVLHFTLGFVDSEHHKYILTQYQPPHDPALEYDVYNMVVLSFQSVVISTVYIVAQIILGLHLWHGAGSWFQTLGLNRRGLQKFISGLGIAVALIVVAGNCSIPLAVLCGLVKPIHP